jgi:hypothetical protein
MSEPCACLCSGFDPGDNEFYAASERKARKSHKCCECGHVIKPGEAYERAAGKSDGGMWAYNTCNLCVEIRTHFYCNGGWLFTQLWDEMREQLFEEGTFRFECMEGLSVPAREKVLAKWRDWKGL